MSSAVRVTPFGVSAWVSMKLRTALPMPARKPPSCVPPDGRWDAVDVAAQVLVGGLRPLQHAIEAQGRSRALPANGSSCTGRAPPLGDDLAEILEDAVLVLEDVASVSRFLLEADLDALVQVAGDLEAFPNQRRVELQADLDALCR